MFKLTAYTSVKVGEKEYHLICDNNSTHGELLDVLNIFSNRVKESEEAVKKLQEKQAQEAPNG